MTQKAQMNQEVGVGCEPQSPLATHPEIHSLQLGPTSQTVHSSQNSW